MLLWGGIQCLVPRDSTVGKALAFHAANSDSIPSIHMIPQNKANKSYWREVGKGETLLISANRQKDIPFLPDSELYGPKYQ